MSNCDRCDKPAEVAVRCYRGCLHNQCAGCARQTQQERNDEIDYDREIGYL
jgi:putative ribosome biogenesis GTPase RsgA